MVHRALQILMAGVLSLFLVPHSARAALSALDSPNGQAESRGNFIQARNFHLEDARVADNESQRQSVTAWQITAGSWNGVALDGLSIVLVQNVSENGQAAPTTNCYVSHLATRAQRDALLSAFVSTRSIPSAETSTWRIEPAVIQIEVSGQTVVLHLGLVA